MSQGIALLANLEQQRKSKRARYTSTRIEEPDVDEDSNSPVFDTYLQTQGPEGIMTLTNFSPSEFNLLWADIRQDVFRHWNIGSGRKCSVKPRDLLLMMLASLKHCGTWDIVAQTFRVTTATFEKRVMSFIEAMHPYLTRKFIHGMASKWTMHELAANGTRFENYPHARYATDVTFQQTNVPVGSYAEKKLFFSGKHHLYGHKVEVSVLPNGLAINCTSYHKGSVSDKAIFDDNLDFHWTNLTKNPREIEMTVVDGQPEQWAVLVDKGYQDGDANTQYINRLNATGMKKIKDKRKAQIRYREKRKTRLSMFLASESAISGNACGSETENVSDSESDCGPSQLF
ncbi:hypothetical protein H310_04360 [Aphanomyces invadans]|uniref:DDE Tnp4 domain-containing protein n=1 Tax=Aphanomyces invadans TaxID=157072 RepID=A0A024UCN0_9STRA|nr:hypothetical protein H310_04360 [Aphanomyces invadans]ETW03945.1 hypothetical protein H310_04360 [Aphanomyces invadans]|eukprot:XP_008866901.1 hypothetical protein H310_04360 [Aphanomyces invadans]